MQTSYESPALISLFQTIFTYQRANELKAELLKTNKVWLVANNRIIE